MSALTTKPVDEGRAAVPLAAPPEVRRVRLSWTDPGFRAIAWQVIVVGGVTLGIVGLALQTAANLQARGIVSGFDFLIREAGFDIPVGWIAFEASDSYARALLLGLTNTLRVAALGVALATVLGLLVGIARFSRIWIIATLARLYVEIMRNTPLLLQLLFWYAIFQGLPRPRDALHPLPGFYLTLRGLYVPSIAWHDGFAWMLLAVVATFLVTIILASVSRQRRDKTGQPLPTIRMVTVFGAIAIAFAIAFGRPEFVLSIPELTGFDFSGGTMLSPEFAALLLGLTTYTAAFIGEIVRGGILAIDKGQTEAAAALGISRGAILRLVVLPQALRVIIPPTTSQYLNLTKNSSLAVAIGYPDLISVANTSMNQTGQAIEVIAIAMAFYLTVSLAISLAMNAYNRAVALPGGGSR
jgi:general L-amino acid transport system permease protein